MKVHCVLLFVQSSESTELDGKLGLKITTTTTTTTTTTSCCCYYNYYYYYLHLQLFLQIVEVLLTGGVDPCQQDCQGNNVVHSIIMQIFYHPELEDTILKSLHHLVSLLSEDQVRNVLLAENMYFLRPVEFAAQHGSCHMVMAIMEIPGVYLYHEERHGLTTYQWYDVTDYEASAERFHKSPLVLLTFADVSIRQSKGFQKLYSPESLFMQWYDTKFKTNIPFIALLFLCRLIYFATFVALDMDTSFYQDYVHGNTTIHCRPGFAPVYDRTTVVALTYSLVAYSFCLIMFDIYETTRYFVKHNQNFWHLSSTVVGKKTWHVQVTFYHYCNLFFSIFVLLFVLIMEIFGGSINSDFYNISRIICPIMAVWNILQTIQLLPSIGPFVITIYNILGDVLNFSVIYFILMIPFLHSFQTVINTNTNVGCIESFENLFRVLYSLFLTMLNMIDYTTYDIRSLEVLLVAHITYTFIVSIMMINFFIALLADTVNKTTKCKETVLAIQRHSVAVMMEKRCQWLFKSLYLKLKKKYFEHEDGKFFLVQVRPNVEQEETQG